MTALWATAQVNEAGGPASERGPSTSRQLDNKSVAITYPCP